MSYILRDRDVYVYCPGQDSIALMRYAVWSWEFSLNGQIHGIKRVWTSEITIIHVNHYHGDMSAMTRKAKDNKPVVQDNGFIGFVNIRLPEDELALVDKALSSKTPPDLGGQLEFLLDKGKISLNYVKGALNATLTVLEGASSGYAVSAFSDSTLESVLILRRKVELYLDQFPDLYANGGTKSRRG